MAKPLIGRDTKLCMSLSARPGNFGSRFQNALYEQLALDYVYKAFSTTDLEGAVRGIRALGIRGCAVSMPFKEAVIPLLDGLAGSALAIQSVNTIVNDDGRLAGYNTDYSAVRDLLSRRWLDRDARFIVRGSGGMAKAVTAAFRDEGFTNGLIVARNPGSGAALAAGYGYRWAAELPAGETAPILVNVTPLGMEGTDAEALTVPVSAIAGCDLAFDVVALPAETPFLKEAARQGKQLISGGDVIVLQAVEQFVLYTGVTPTQDQIDAAAAIARS